MDMMRHLMVVVILGFVYGGFVRCERPKSVNVGAIFTFSSLIGRAAKPAMEAALANVNMDSSILSGTELRLLFEDADCNVFLGSIEGHTTMERHSPSGPQPYPTPPNVPPRTYNNADLYPPPQANASVYPPPPPSSPQYYSVLEYRKFMLEYL